MAENVTVSIPKLFAIEIPIEKGIEQQARHLDIQLTTTDRAKLSWMYHGLRKSNAKLANGRAIESTADVVRYILQNLDIPTPSKK